MFRIRLLPFALLLSVAPALAQTPDTTAAQRYVPVAVGNIWHVSGEHDNGYWTERESYQYVVESEQPDAPGRFVVAWTRRYQQFQTSPVSVSSGSAVWTSASTMPGAPCPLGAPFGAPVVFGTQGTYAVTGGPGQTVQIGGQSVTATRKQFARSGSGSTYIFSIQYEYAAGIGQTRSVQSSFSGADSRRDEWRLNYARVGGAEYGQPLSFPSSGDDRPDASALDVRVWPNPATSAATAHVTLTAPTTVRLVVTDALGRDVLADVRSLGVGTHTLPIDTARLAPGLYVVRIAAGMLAGTQRLAVAR